MTKYDSILFDSDGVLVTPPAYETQMEVTQAAFEAVGIRDVKRQYIDEIVTGVSVNRLHEICMEYRIDVGEFWEEWEHYDEQSQFEEFKKGVRVCYDDIMAINDLSQKCGVVSNNHHTTIEFVIDNFDLEHLFDTFYGREKTVESLDLQKPNTHYLELALADLEAESALYIGDSESDMVAAHRAGLDSAFLHRPHCSELDLTTLPIYEVSTLHDLSSILSQ